MARRCGLSQSMVSRIWRAFALQTASSRGFKLSKDPLFIEKVRDIVGLYLNPPTARLVLCVDEKSQIQALESQSAAVADAPGQAERRAPDYLRHGTTNLFAALDFTGRHRDRAVSSPPSGGRFRQFLETIEPTRSRPGLRSI